MEQKYDPRRSCKHFETFFGPAQSQGMLQLSVHCAPWINSAYLTIAILVCRLSLSLSLSLPLFLCLCVSVCMCLCVPVCVCACVFTFDLKKLRHRIYLRFRFHFQLRNIGRIFIRKMCWRIVQLLLWLLWLWLYDYYYQQPFART